MAADLPRFIPLAVVTNTAFPLPFDCVLLRFAARHTFREASVFAALGSGRAGRAGLVDVAVIGAAGRRWAGGKTRAVAMSRAGRSFYVAVVLVALLPIPYTVIRIALLSVRPRPMVYALSLSLARLPRYVLLIRVWQGLALPDRAGGALVLSSAAWVL
ncbi:MAG: hypothetical protein H0X69_00790 [Gemmatimonadales bacterium]|nr:hypothetical protein [Gemmatimonadales bacterium]